MASVTDAPLLIAIRPTHGGTVKKTAIAGVIVGAVALALSGCSSSSDESTPTSTGPAKVAPPAILQAGTLKICAPNDGTPPSVYHNETGALVGSEVDLGKAIAAKLGLKPDFVESAFAAVIPTLAGQAVRRHHGPAVHQAGARKGRRLRALRVLGHVASRCRRSVPPTSRGWTTACAARR